MVQILLSGCGGRMGKAVAALIKEDENCRICAGIDVAVSAMGETDFPVYGGIGEFPGKADVIIDFSHHTSAPGLLSYAEKHQIPIVIATTGHTEEEVELIQKYSASIPVFYSRNMSLGVNLLCELVKKTASMLGEDFDVEIVEMHHNKKLDAPSGTAIMIAEAAEAGLSYQPEYVYDRHSVRKERNRQEIGIHSVRGGTIVGEHEVIFAGKDEVLKLSHSAYSREIFASGARKAALFLIGKKPGLYHMGDLVSQIVEG